MASMNKKFKNIYGNIWIRVSIFAYVYVCLFFLKILHQLFSYNLSSYEHHFRTFIALNKVNP
ncbi:Protein of unknown function [Gryllus bimaculatus]|nr:Protein of unknown function [Gryllus bimaculatus]